MRRYWRNPGDRVLKGVVRQGFPARSIDRAADYVSGASFAHPAGSEPVRAGKQPHRVGEEALPAGFFPVLPGFEAVGGGTLATAFAKERIPARKEAASTRS